MSDDEQYDYGELLVLQHDADTGPDTLVPLLDGRANRRPWQLVDLPSEGVPGLTERTAGILVLGGPQSVVDADTLPWLDDELSLLRTAVETDVPVFGICLGAQLLAAALGGEVTRRETPEVVFAPTERTLGAEDDEVFAGWPDGTRVLLSHEDEVTTLPDGAVEMLHTSGGSVAWRTTAALSYGVQFHPEISADGFDGWMARDELRSTITRAGEDPDDVAAEVRRREPFLKASGVAMVGRWIDGVVGRDDPMPRPKRKKKRR